MILVYFIITIIFIYYTIMNNSANIKVLCSHYYYFEYI